MSVLDIENLNVEYHTGQETFHAVKGISLSVEPGEIVGIMGESGSGKSTAMLAVMGLLGKDACVTADRIRLLDGRPCPGRNIAMVFQDSLSCLNPSLRIGRQIGETVRLRERCGRREAARRTEELLEMAGIREAKRRMKQYPFELSGGMRQRVVIAAALACRPALIIADEPTTALDAAVQAQILFLLKRIVRETGTSLLLVTHDPGVTASMCDRVYVMQAGRIVESGIAEDVFYDPREEYTRQLLPSGRSGKKAWSRSSFRKNTIEGQADILVSMEHLSRQYDTRDGIRDLTLSIRRGEVFALVGESGSGKTTLARLLSGILSPDGGRMVYSRAEKAERNEAENRTEKKAENRENTGTDSGRKNIGKGQKGPGPIQMVFQDSSGALNPCLTAGQALEEALRESGLSGQERKERAAAMLEEVGLSREDGKRYPDSFSGGQRQRIGIARALITEPELLICDEALASLDTVTRGQILELLMGMKEKRDLTILFISHDLRLVRQISSRIGVMYGGRLAETGPAKDVCADPWHPYTRQLLDAVPEADPLRARKMKAGYGAGSGEGCEAGSRERQELLRHRKNRGSAGSACPFAGQCSYAMECCFTETPEAYAFGERMVSCFLYSEKHSGKRGSGYTMTSQI